MKKLDDIMMGDDFHVGVDLRLSEEGSLIN